MLKTGGTIKVDVENQRVVINVSYDFIQYYQWFLRREYGNIINSPLFGAHVTLASRKHHNNVNWELAHQQYHNKKIEFDYSEDIYVGGRKKGFRMFYVKVFSAEIDEIKKDIGVVEDGEYRGLHITIGSYGKRGSVIKPWWPEMITID